MLKRLLLGCGLLGGGALWAQMPPPGVELANLREDVRGLVQRVGELSLRVEQLERENRELRGATSSASQSYATVTQLNAAVADLNRLVRAAAADTKNETLQQVGVQMERLARQTQAAIDSAVKGAGPRPPAPTSFSADYPKEGVSYTVQRGDTLALIAKKKNAKQQDIINANELADPARIQVGQTLFIPGGK
jgi:LysM repeat protein